MASLYSASRVGSSLTFIPKASLYPVIRLAQVPLLSTISLIQVLITMLFLACCKSFLAHVLFSGFYILSSKHLLKHYLQYVTCLFTPLLASLALASPVCHCSFSASLLVSDCHISRCSVILVDARLVHSEPLCVSLCFNCCGSLPQLPTPLAWLSSFFP